MQCSMAAVFSPSEADSDIIFDRFVGPAVPDKRVKFRDPRLTVLEKCDPKSSATAFSAIFRLQYVHSFVRHEISPSKISRNV